MRDKRRINRIMFKVNRLWRMQPDWRFGQLVDNVWVEDEGGVSSREVDLLFELEDDRFEAGLDNLLQKMDVALPKETERETS